MSGGSPAEPELRRAARAVLLDPQGAILLQRSTVDEGSIWVTPGGGVERGESTESALAREMVEELGLAGLAVGPAIWTRRHVWNWNGRWYDQHETYHLFRVPERLAVAPTLSAEVAAAELILEHRWWTVDEIESHRPLVAPRRLAALLRDLLVHGPPDGPLDAGV